MVHFDFTKKDRVEDNKTKQTLSLECASIDEKKTYPIASLTGVGLKVSFVVMMTLTHLVTFYHIHFLKLLFVST